MNKTRNILAITYWNLDNALIQTYTLPYLRQIQKLLPPDSKIYLFTLNEKNKRELLKSEIRELALENIHVLPFVYKKFGWEMCLRLIWIVPYLTAFCHFKKIHTIHAWCTPGGAIAWPVSVFSGKRLVLDSFEPHAESMAETGSWKRSGLSFRILFLLEKLQLKRACEVICATEAMIEHSQAVYGIVKPQYYVKPACVDLDLFDPNRYSDSLPELQLRKHVCVYAGKFGDLYLDLEVFHFFKTALDHYKGEFSLILLSSHSDQEIQEFCVKSGFPFSCITKRFVPHDQVPRYMKLAQFGICTIRPVPSKRFGTPIKNGEYWAMGLPVIIPEGISIDSHIIASNNIGYVLKEFNVQEYKKALEHLDVLLENKQLGKTIRQIAYRERNFKLAEAIYEKIYAKHLDC